MNVRSVDGETYTLTHDAVASLMAVLEKTPKTAQISSIIVSNLIYIERVRL